MESDAMSNMGLQVTTVAAADGSRTDIGIETHGKDCRHVDATNPDFRKCKDLDTLQFIRSPHRKKKRNQLKKWFSGLLFCWGWDVLYESSRRKPG